MASAVSIEDAVARVEGLAAIIQFDDPLNVETAKGFERANPVGN